MPADERQKGADLADIVEHLRWRLWHGQVRRALDLVGETLLSPKRNGRDELCDSQGSFQSGAGSRRARDLCCRAFQLDHRLRDSPAMRRTVLDVTPPKARCNGFCTVRMASQQQMRWSPRGAHLMLEFAHPSSTAASVYDHAAAGRWSWASVSERGMTTPRFLDGF